MAAKVERKYLVKTTSGGGRRIEASSTGKDQCLDPQRGVRARRAARNKRQAGKWDTDSKKMNPLLPASGGSPAKSWMRWRRSSVTRNPRAGMKPSMKRAKA